MEAMKKRNTIQRQLVLQAVIDHGMHPTADEVYDKVDVYKRQGEKG